MCVTRPAPTYFMYPHGEIEDRHARLKPRATFESLAPRPMWRTFSKVRQEMRLKSRETLAPDGSVYDTTTAGAPSAEAG